MHFGRRALVPLDWLRLPASPGRRCSRGGGLGGGLGGGRPGARRGVTPRFARVLSAAILDGEAAYLDAASRAAEPANRNLMGGFITGQLFTAGVHEWGTGVSFTGQLFIRGTANNVFIFKIAGALVAGSGARVELLGGAMASNVFWQVGGRVDAGINSHLEGIFLAQTSATFRVGSSLSGRVFAHTAVFLQMAARAAGARVVDSARAGRVQTECRALRAGTSSTDGEQPHRRTGRRQLQLLTYPTPPLPLPRTPRGFFSRASRSAGVSCTPGEHDAAWVLHSAGKVGSVWQGGREALPSAAQSTTRTSGQPFCAMIASCSSVSAAATLRSVSNTQSAHVSIGDRGAARRPSPRPSPSPRPRPRPRSAGAQPEQRAVGALQRGQSRRPVHREHDRAA